MLPPTEVNVSVVLGFRYRWSQTGHGCSERSIQESHLFLVREFEAGKHLMFFHHSDRQCCRCCCAHERGRCYWYPPRLAGQEAFPRLLDLSRNSPHRCTVVAAALVGRCRTTMRNRMPRRMSCRCEPRPFHCCRAVRSPYQGLGWSGRCRTTPGYRRLPENCKHQYHSVRKGNREFRIRGEDCRHYVFHLVQGNRETLLLRGLNCYLVGRGQTIPVPCGPPHCGRSHIPELGRFANHQHGLNGPSCRFQYRYSASRQRAGRLRRCHPPRK